MLDSLVGSLEKASSSGWSGSHVSVPMDQSPDFLSVMADWTRGPKALGAKDIGRLLARLTLEDEILKERPLLISQARLMFSLPITAGPTV